MSYIPPFQRFHDQHKDEIMNELPSATKLQCLQAILDKWETTPESDRVVYEFDDFDTMTCSVEDNGAVLIKQPWFHCRTCWPNDKKKGCCIVCAKKCHVGHKVEFLGWQLSYCDCALSGKCQHYHKKPIKFNDKPFESISNRSMMYNEPQIHVPTGNFGMKFYNSNNEPFILNFSKMNIHPPKITEDVKRIKNSEIPLFQIGKSNNCYIHPIFGPPTPHTDN
ncbi:hypothetical protein TVAG_174540 [Trichomonas vaginalis G3]|uniref:UBR-type domain-containing protein n=1 Tax=Trichomonas vaginalis (strain ATCC PRA-98 / G3) TaxID=412133 RepID=A2EK01_TRIV3|nr:perineurial glial growth protein family [Trichomonas vaginalis G3]EAY06985.1 hypothetical protein TVAG_174540 [Trichomonas vaginalis G3]KAI5488835.1 perineurial glial growth protein family [Trichomonas vaginalis G3]|eukprot:XP_001319208.1 hypothetical protein [Trichomonas vaginalis G3]